MPCDVRSGHRVGLGQIQVQHIRTLHLTDTTRQSNTRTHSEKRHEYKRYEHILFPLRCVKTTTHLTYCLQELSPHILDSHAFIPMVARALDLLTHKV